MTKSAVFVAMGLMIIGCQTGTGPGATAGDTAAGNNGGSSGGSGPHLEMGGQVIVEAEHYTRKSPDPVGGREWELQAGEQAGPGPDPDGYHNGASADGYVELLPDTRVTDADPIGGGAFYNDTTEGASLSFEIEFEMPGIYYVWGRAHSTGTEDNGLHVGVDDQIFESGLKMQWCGAGLWTWSNAQRDTGGSSCGVNGTITINVPSAGRHIVTFYQREDGFELDRFILTTDPEFKPEGAGPLESPRLNP